jgi:hypothetical protein
MSNQHEQQSDCDAPAYSVVRACQGLGFHLPLDVRWCCMSHFLARHGEQSGIFGLGAWAWLFGRSHSPDKRCVCGQPLPALERYTFTFESERQAVYLLGQCRRCYRVFWEEVHCSDFGPA